MLKHKTGPQAVQARKLYQAMQSCNEQQLSRVIAMPDAAVAATVSGDAARAHLQARLVELRLLLHPRKALLKRGPQLRALLNLRLCIHSGGLQRILDNAWGHRGRHEWGYGGGGVKVKGAAQPYGVSLSLPIRAMTCGVTPEQAVIQGQWLGSPDMAHLEYLCLADLGAKCAIHSADVSQNLICSHRLRATIGPKHQYFRELYQSSIRSCCCAGGRLQLTIVYVCLCLPFRAPGHAG